ncbi:hypothetical protein BHE74_00012682 [Ensete ventricosum]|nr:hypothetical protein GW17_00020652 [Ensete ventricosum]RWW79053.1 hypothetical protein BHE74_00012682 [Ensete ventricosum]RZR92020.1 hypothetical protein BHM03_00020243 [Ensete ventricosum]
MGPRAFRENLPPQTNPPTKICQELVPGPRKSREIRISRNSEERMHEISKRMSSRRRKPQRDKSKRHGHETRRDKERGMTTDTSSELSGSGGPLAIPSDRTLDLVSSNVPITTVDRRGPHFTP